MPIVNLVTPGSRYYPPGSGTGSPVSFDFNSGTSGANVTSYLDDKFGTNGIFAVDQAYSGSGKSMKTTCPNGASGFDDGFGYMLRLKDGAGNNANLVAGDELWWRTRVYFDPTYSFDDANPFQKFFRIKTSGPSDDPISDAGEGHLDVYIDRPASGDNAFHFVLEGQLGPTGFEVNEYFGSYAAGTCCHVGQWETWEVYAKLGSTVESSKHRFWRNGVLIGDSTLIKTLNDSTHYVGAVLLFTYFNGNAPRNETVWIDDIVYYHTKGAGGVPPNTDAGGNPFIGTG